MKPSVCFVNKYKGLPVINGIYNGEDLWDLIEIKIEEFIQKGFDIRISITFNKEVDIKK